MPTSALLASRARLTAMVLLIAALAGCAEVSRVVPSATWHQKCGWQAEDYFDDPQVVALCQAIEANDLAEIDRLVAAGADVNVQGEGKMTPLLWAFPDNKLPRFQRLLEHGANPNVVIESDFNTRGGMSAGDSVTHMVCKTSFPGYFEAVFAHGGDANLAKNGFIPNQSTLFTLLLGSAPNRSKKIELLVEKGADLDHVDGSGGTATMLAVGSGNYEIGLQLLEAGADPGVYQENQLQKLTHVVVRQEHTHLKYASPEQKADYQRLVAWLEEHGESLDEARADLDRWGSWSLSTGEYKRMTDAEIAARKAREAREKAAAEGADQEAD